MKINKILKIAQYLNLYKFSCILIFGLQANIIDAQEFPTERIAFGSCVDSPEGVIWESINAAKPDYFLLLGDVAYLPESLAGKSAEIFNFYQSVYNSKTAAGKLTNQVKTFAIWDDHDYGINNGAANFKGAPATRKSFVKFWKDNPEPVAELYPALTFRYTSELLDLFVLDGRSFREKPKKGIHLFGAKQMNWLKQEIHKDSSRLLVIASGTPFLLESKGKESFSKYQQEQAMFLDMLLKLKRPVVLLSGDRHFGQILKYPNSQIIEVISSSLTAPVAAKRKQFLSKYGVGLIAEHNFGMLTVSRVDQQIYIETGLYDQQGRQKVRALL